MRLVPDCCGHVGGHAALAGARARSTEEFRGHRDGDVRQLLTGLYHYDDLWTEELWLGEYDLSVRRRGPYESPPGATYGSTAADLGVNRAPSE